MKSMSSYVERMLSTPDPPAFLPLRVEPTVERVRNFVHLRPSSAVGGELGEKALTRYLLHRPVLRAAHTYRSAGLSPVALAGLLGVPPREVVKQAQAENGLELWFCADVWLPVLGRTWNPLTPFYSVYDPGVDLYLKEQEELDEDPDVNDCDCLDCETARENREKLKKKYKKEYPFPRTLEAFMRKYSSPRTWRRYAKPNFNPFFQDVFLISPVHWDELLEAVWLEPFKDGKRVKGGERD